ncbi:hypothetical protein QTI66_38740 [Variovorax sp. J22R133]|uniref:hypothetical protein n=1 Tax=Variovorax brevis TaxID=3053503 RepID=UPI00257660A2|nr:hypothetical protein [Variovorax sp. J22R133]MDM0118022.1 hypothetical protein [Variovorax sp. J22R133]
MAYRTGLCGHLRVSTGTTTTVDHFASLDELAREIAHLASSFTLLNWSRLDTGRALVSILRNGSLLRLENRERQPHGVAGIWKTVAFREIEAFGERGQPLAIAGLMERSRALQTLARAERRRIRSGLTIYSGFGPVPGVHRKRGGHWIRQIATMSERRSNGLVVIEDGEHGARRARMGRQLPSSWEDIGKCTQRSWKAQFKGRKAWDRA